MRVCLHVSVTTGLFCKFGRALAPSLCHAAAVHPAYDTGSPILMIPTNLICTPHAPDLRLVCVLPSELFLVPANSGQPLRKAQPPTEDDGVPALLLRADVLGGAEEDEDADLCCQVNSTLQFNAARFFWCAGRGSGGWGRRLVLLSDPILQFNAPNCLDVLGNAEEDEDADLCCKVIQSCNPMLQSNAPICLDVMGEAEEDEDAGLFCKVIQCCNAMLPGCLGVLGGAEEGKACTAR
eukprot:1137561-Pelagomonas_calceolata.AAC.2